MKRGFIISILILFTLTGGCSFGARNADNIDTIELNICAAASLTDAAEEIRTAYTKNHPGVKITFNFASSGTLQKQIEEGAPADLFISAGKKEMDKLENQELIITDSRKDLLSNEIVLIAGKDSGLKDWTSLIDSSVNKISIGVPETVPVGKYAKEVLTSLDLYEKIQSKLVLAKDVRQVLTYIETGNVDAGIVYRSDTYQAQDIRIVDPAPSGSHEAIVYPMAVIKASKKQAAAGEFAEFLTGMEADIIFKKYGFIPLEQMK